MVLCAVSDPVFVVIAPSIRPKPQRRRKDGTLIPVRSYSWTRMTEPWCWHQIVYVDRLCERHPHLWLLEVQHVRKHPRDAVHVACHRPVEAELMPYNEWAAIMRGQFPNADIHPSGTGAVLRDANDLVKLFLLDRVE